MHSEDIIIVNVYIPDCRASKYKITEKLYHWKEKQKKLLLVKDVTSLSII